jgi:hypothetical protein
MEEPVVIAECEAVLSWLCVRITAPGRDGGMVELIHALAAIVVRLERERRMRRDLDLDQEQPHDT